MKKFDISFKWFLPVFLFLSGIAFSQPEVPVNEFGLKVVNSKSLYLAQVAVNVENTLLNLEGLAPNLRKDVKYATTDNVTKQVLYTTPGVFLRKPAAEALKKIAEELALNGIGLVVYDAYRPYSITKKIWEFVLDEDFAASPKTGSRHNRGCAIDIGLYDIVSGELLEMPTVFDDFTEKASHKYMKISPQQRINRALLRTVMEKHGFKALESEWWHYDYSSWQSFDLMDISFEDLK
ncbi:MAG: M15 family metallopeptidase [Bacteroidetes bacterium]|nr:M15 family metallopeptidase [Bacteroidota bacterium]